MNDPGTPREYPAGLKTILIVDDDVHLAAALALALESNGYRTLHAANAAIGWELARNHLPDLILSDVEMPGKDGRRLLLEMRADPELRTRQFVLMTGKLTFGNQRTAMDLGADDFLLKPFSLTDLLRCVEARLKRAEMSRRLDEGAVAKLQQSLRSSLPHEFFAPLASVLGLTEMLLLDFDKLSPTEVRQELQTIHGAGRRLHRNLRNYLLILELESPGVDRALPWLEETDVAEALTSGAATAAEHRQRSDDLVLDVTGARVRAKASDLGIMMEELVDNALNYSRKKTPVEVQTRREGGTLRIIVNDAGRGMTPEQLQSLDSTWQRSRSTGEKRDVGLGLMLVRRLAQNLGGEFRLESRDGRGTTASVTLPIRTD